MYLSQLTLNIKNRQAVKDQANPYELHRTLSKAFPQYKHEEERILFRLEGERFESVLVQSTLEPDWEKLIVSSRYLLKEPGVKTFECLNFAKGQLLRFRLRANPIRRDSKSKKRVALHTVEERFAWLERKGRSNGFIVKQDMMTSHSTTWRQFTMPVKDIGRKKVTFNMVDYEGVLIVDNPVLLNQAVRQGIGPAKGLGCGLLSLARV